MNCFVGGGGLLLVAAVALPPQAVRSQEWASAASLYNKGVNAYFAGRTSEAESLLSQAIELEPEDPRAYYFRALSQMRLGRTDEARGDVMVASAVEALAPGRFAIGQALEQVQGGSRLTLERYRREARQATADNRLQFQRRPVQQVSNLDSGVLRRRITISLDQLLQSSESQPSLVDESTQRSTEPWEVGRPSSQPAGAGIRPSAPALREDPFRDDASQGPSIAPPMNAPPQPADATAPSAPRTGRPGSAGEAEVDPFEP